MERLTIDEAIAMVNNRAIICEHSYDRFIQLEKKQWEQIAEWLEELKDYQDKNKMVVRVDVENMDSIKDKIEELSKYAERQYNKAIDDFVEKLLSAFDETNIKEYGFYPENLVRQVAEQLRQMEKVSKKQVFKITCKICGKEFIANSCQKSLCSDKCKEESKLRIARERALKLEKENNREKYRKENRKAIVDLAVEARKAGMTYGQYTAMLMMQKERETE